MVLKCLRVDRTQISEPSRDACHVSSSRRRLNTVMTTLHVAAAATSFVIQDDIKAKGYSARANYWAGYIYTGLMVRVCVP